MLYQSPRNGLTSTANNHKIQKQMFRVNTVGGQAWRTVGLPGGALRTWSLEARLAQGEGKTGRPRVDRRAPRDSYTAKDNTSAPARRSTSRSGF